MSYDVGSLLLSVGVDVSTARNSLNQVQNIYKSGMMQVAKGFTKSLTSGVMSAVNTGVAGAVSGGLGGLGVGVAGAVSGGFVGAMAGVGTLVESTIGQAVELGISSRFDLANSMISGYADNLFKGLEDYAEEERSIRLANTVLGIRDTEGFNPANPGRDSERRMLSMQKSITEIATELSFDRATIAKMIEQLARTGAEEEELLGDGSKASRAASLATTTAYLAESMALPAYQMDEAVKLMTMARAAYGELSNMTLASGILGVYANTAQDTGRLKYGLQDALPAGAAAGVGYEDVMSTLATLGNFSSFEVAGTLAKTIFNAMANPERINRGVASAIAPAYENIPGGFIGELKREGNLIEGLKGIMDNIEIALKEGRLASLPGMDKFTAEYTQNLSERALDQLTQKFFVKLLGGSETMIQATRGITEQSADSIDRLRESIEKFVSGKLEDNTPVLEAFVGVKQEGILGAQDLISSSINNVQVLLGQNLAPALVSFVSFFKNVANDLTANIGNMTGGLQTINEMFSNLFNNPEFVGNFSRGVQNVVFKLNGIFLGWSESIVNFLSDSEKVDTAFERIGDLSVTMADGFTVLLGVMRNFLPVIGDWGDKLGGIGRTLSAQVDRQYAEQEAEADKISKEATGQKGQGVSTSTVDSTPNVLRTALGGSKPIMLENPDKQLVELNESAQQDFKDFVKQGGGVETGLVRTSNFPFQKFAGVKADDTNIETALKNIKELTDGEGNRTGIFKGPTFDPGSPNLFYRDQQGEIQRLMGNERNMAQILDKITQSNLTTRDMGKGAEQSRDLGADGLSSLVPKEVSKEIDEKAREKYFDAAEPLNNLSIVEATKRYVDERDNNLLMEQQKATEELFGKNVQFDAQSGNFTNLQEANVSIPAFAQDLDRLRKLIEIAGSKGDFEGQDGALNAILSESSQLSRDNDLKFLTEIIAGGTAKAGDIEIKKGTFQQVVGQDKEGEDIVETRGLVFTDAQLQAAVQTGTQEGVAKSLIESSNQNIETQKQALLEKAQSGDLFDVLGNVRGKEVEAYIDQLKENKEFNGNMSKFFEDILSILKDRAEEEGQTPEEEVRNTNLYQAFTRELKLDRGLSDAQIGNDAVLASDSSETQKLLNQLTQQRLKAEMEIAKIKQRTLAVEREMVVASKAINGELNSSLSEYAGLLNAIGNLRLRAEESDLNLRNQITGEQNSARRQFANVTTEDRTIEVGGQDVTYLVPTSDQSDAEGIANEQRAKFEAMQTKWLSQQEQYSKEVQSAIQKIVNQVARVAQSAIGNVTSIVGTLNQAGSGQNIGFVDQGGRVLDSVKQQSLKLIQSIQTLEAARVNSPGAFSPEQERNLNGLLVQFRNLPSQVVEGLNDIVDSFRENLEKYFSDAIAKQEQRDLNISRLQAGDNPILQAMVQSRQEQLGLFQQLAENGRQLSALQRESNALSRQSALYQALTAQFGKEGFDQTKVFMNEMAQSGNASQREALGLDREGLIDSFQRKMAITFMQTLDKFASKLTSINNIFSDTSLVAYKFSKQLDEMNKEMATYEQSIKALDALYGEASDYLNEANLLKKEELDQVKAFADKMKDLNEELKNLSFNQQLERIQGETTSLQAQRESLVIRGEADNLRNRATLLRSETGYGFDQDIEVAQLELAAKMKEFDARLAEIAASSGARINELQNDLALKVKSLESGELQTTEERQLATAEIRKLEEQIALEQQKLNNESTKIRNQKEVQLELAQDEVSMSGRVGKELANTTKGIFDQLYDTLTEGGTSLGDRFKNLGKTILKQFGKIGWDMLMGKITSGITNAFTKKDKTQGQEVAEKAEVVESELNFGNRPDFEGFGLRAQQAFTVDPSEITKLMSETFTKRLDELAKFSADGDLATSISKQFDLFAEELGATDLGGLLGTTATMGMEGVAMNTSLTANNTKLAAEILQKIYDGGGLRNVGEYKEGEAGGTLKGRDLSDTKVTSKQGMRWHPTRKRYEMHYGTDFALGGGTELFSPADATVTESKRLGDSSQWILGLEYMDDLGRKIHDRYVHLGDQFTKQFEVGDKVASGQKIGIIDPTDASDRKYSTGDHLHLERKIDGKLLNTPQLLESLSRQERIGEYGEGSDTPWLSNDARKADNDNTHARKNNAAATRDNTDALNAHTQAVRTKTEETIQYTDEKKGLMAYKDEVKAEQYSDRISNEDKYSPIDPVQADLTSSFLDDSMRFTGETVNLDLKQQEQVRKNQFTLNQGFGLAQQALTAAQSPAGGVVGKIGGLVSAISSGGGFGAIAMGILPLLAGLFGGKREKPKRYNTGVSAVPGNGTTDSVPALLTPGEAVLTRAAVERLGGRDFIEAANFGRMEFLHKNTGGIIPSHYGASSRDLKRFNKGGIVKPSSLGMKKFQEPLRASYTALEASKYNKMTENQRNIEQFANESDGSAMGLQGDTYKDNNNMKVEYQSTVINNVSYVTEDQFQAGIEQAINRSQQGVFRQMRSSPRTRRSLGMR